MNDDLSLKCLPTVGGTKAKQITRGTENVLDGVSTNYSGRRIVQNPKHDVRSLTFQFGEREPFTLECVKTNSRLEDL
jgi:hypothetical protein